MPNPWFFISYSRVEHGEDWDVSVRNALASCGVLVYLGVCGAFYLVGIWIASLLRLLFPDFKLSRKS